MGFLKRFFSMGSRKSKRRQRSRDQHDPMPVDAEGRLQAMEPWQVEATRLLRSSSAHFTSASAVDVSTLPPLPVTPGGFLTPVTTPARSMASTLKRSGTYTVTVHDRVVHSRTEFPNANPSICDEPTEKKPHAGLRYYDESPTKPKSHPNPRSVPFTPRDQGRLHRLRQDPSVASLLNMYDDKGRIQSNAFSNTPPNAGPLCEVEGREQKKRNGSTLRQLMGELDTGRVADCTALEGDISWAERELARVDRTSMSTFVSECSLPLDTPKDTHFDDDHSAPHVVTNNTFTSDYLDSSANWPVISSLEVELSGTTSLDYSEHHTAILDGAAPTTEQELDMKTPQRASEVFGFLTERRKSILERKQAISDAQTLPPLPGLAVPGLAPPSRTLSTTSSSVMSTPALSATATTATNSSNSSPTASSDTSSAQIHHATLTKVTPMSRSTDNLNILYTPSALPRALSPQPTANSILSHSTAGQPSKIPRGPRPAPTSSSKHAPAASQSSLYLQDAVSAVSVAPPVEPEPVLPPSRIPKSSSRSGAYDPYTPLHKRPHRRTASRTSNMSASVLALDNENAFFDDRDEEEESAYALVPPPKRGSRRASHAEDIDKENSPSSQAESRKAYPKTPAIPRSNQHSHSRALFDARHPNLINNIGMGEPPSPAKSIDLSPVAREMMDDVRKRRRQGVRAGSGGRNSSRVVSGDKRRV